jgi:hypothetical protein
MTCPTVWLPVVCEDQTEMDEPTHAPQSIWYNTAMLTASSLVNWLLNKENSSAQFESDLPKEMPDFAIVLPWHFRDNISLRQKDYMPRGGKLIFPFPDVEVLSS